MQTEGGRNKDWADKRCQKIEERLLASQLGGTRQGADDQNKGVLFRGLTASLKSKNGVITYWAL